MPQLILAHDLGTSGDKASLHAADGRLLASHTERYATDFGPGGKAEQDPADWWAAFCAASRSLLERTGTDPADVACVAMSGQMMGVVLVDEHGQALRPAIIWADTRAEKQARALAERFGVERGYDLLGHPIDPTYCLAKMMWLREHEPATWERATSVLVAKDYITLRLTGRRCTDPSDASGTNAWDQRAATWSAELLEAAGIDVGLLPEVLPSATVAAGVRAEAAIASGLREGTPVVVGGADGSCAPLGAGLVSGDSAANATIGSSAWISIASDSPLRDPLRRVVTFDHVVPGRYVPLGAMQAAGVALDWVVLTLGASRPAERAAAARCRRPGRGGQRGPLLPALPAGRACPDLGRTRPRHLHRPLSSPSTGAPGPGRPGGRGLQSLWHLPGALRDGRVDRGHRRHRWRGTQR